MLAGHLGKYSRFEIERKFLLPRLPADLPAEFVEIEDTYLPNSSLRLRIERSPKGQIIGRKLTKKDKAPNEGPQTSIITSLYLSEDDLIALGDLKGQRLRKRRYIYENERNRFVYDEFKDGLAGLILAEVEFTDQESCANFRPDDADWKEVTGNPDYSGGFLAG